jgi:hypothetical protein
MILTSRNIAYYLLERRFITPESLVDGDFVVVDTSRRNRNFKVIRKRDPGYFIKQVQQWEPQAIATLQREAMCYWLSGNDPNFAPLAPLLPKYYGFDPDRHILITELLPDAENLSEYQRRLGVFPVEVGSQLGEILGTYHRTIPARLENSSQQSVFPGQPPWILSVHHLSGHPTAPMSAANSQLLGVVQKYPEFQRPLDELRAQWRTNSLIHGDMKWDNCMVYAGNDKNDELEIKIVDWELSDFGDACWDVGAIFQAYLVFWITSFQGTADVAPERLVETAQYPLEQMQPAIRTFWSTYVDTLQVDGRAAEELLERSMKYGAARMIQTAYEHMYYSPQITASALYLLQVSWNILESPKEAISYLLGI